MPEFDFAKSSHSNTGGECVEVARNVVGVVAVRDTKTPTGDPIVQVTPATWTTFTEFLR
ncbi:DUF397 domain-containing protein [Streptomyces sp. SID8379]|uniref:DUF397 domain-containing protein n=1 Tax=unclassified Streptomyces TaxID=2593676 RepID=UPI00035D4D5A|nr:MULTISPECIES: DUF397 domain-containing protein [unclassified Streptomyces]MYW65768.1 DUF397 domain-containing protein [Streptomyces sp. SID8379]